VLDGKIDAKRDGTWLEPRDSIRLSIAALGTTQHVTLDVCPSTRLDNLEHYLTLEFDILVL
jgi:hypothetical protein